MNPYDYLGINRNASENEVMDAYRKRAGEINNSDLTEEERSRYMSELDMAYDSIMNQIRGNFNYTEYNNQNSRNQSQYADVRQCINAGRIDDAETILNGVPAQMRNAEWNYLKGLVHQRRGWLNEAYKYYQVAFSMEPQNSEYANAYNAMNRSARGGYRTSEKSGGSDVCDICSSLICADCCCECCGGDLIPCC